MTLHQSVDAPGDICYFNGSIALCVGKENRTGCNVTLMPIDSGARRIEYVLENSWTKIETTH